MIELGPGRTLADGRYTLERLLGAGGMATVWLARDERLDRRVAVKLLADVLALDPSYVERFRREARIAAQLWHPNLVQVYDFDVDGDRPLLVMEVVDGPTLAEVLRDRRRAAEIDAGRLAAELLGALAHIHAAGVVHRDVKPANVLIGGEGRARLTDFGIAQPAGGTRLTMTGGVIGTLGYLAPEVVAGGAATPCSDLYSCGVVLRGLLDAAAGSGGGTDARLAELIERLTRADANDRPATADAALALLEPSTDPPTRVAPARAQAATTRVQPRRAAPAPAGVAPDRVDELAASTAAAARALAERVLAHPLGLTLAGVVAGAVIVLLLVALASGGSGSGAGSNPRRAATAPASVPAAPAANAPFADQLRALDRTLSAIPSR